MRKIYLLDLLGLMGSGLEMDLAPREGDANWTRSVEEFEKDGIVSVRETWTSADGSSTYVKTYMESAARQKEDARALESMLQEAVEREEYEKAAQLRDMIKELKK